MNTRQPPAGKKFFTAAEANRMLPLVRAIVRDIVTLARDLRERHEFLTRSQAGESGLSPAHQEELDEAVEEFERLRQKLMGFEQELAGLGVELKDRFLGLIDFPCWKDGREVYLCWLLDEPEVAHWHELTAGFTGRQPLLQDAAH